MSFADKIKKIKNKLNEKNSVFSLNYLSGEEKTGVITGLVLLGAASGYLLSQSSEAEASSCVSGWANNAAAPGVVNKHLSGWRNWGQWCDWLSWCNWCRWSRWSQWTEHSNAGP